MNKSISIVFALIGGVLAQSGILSPAVPAAFAPALSYANAPLYAAGGSQQVDIRHNYDGTLSSYTTAPFAYAGPFSSRYATGLPTATFTAATAPYIASYPAAYASPAAIAAAPAPLTFALIALCAVVFVQAKPSHPFDFHALPEHFAYATPEFLHSAPLPIGPSPLWPAPAPLFAAPAPAPLLPAPAPLLPAPAPLLPAPAPLLHTPVLAAPAPAPLPVPLPVPLAPIPTYRAIPGPKTTTHHVSVGYAFPQPVVARPIVAPHAHFHAAPLSWAHHHHHHSLF
ncbi:uncharacterized protein ACN2A1_004645 [Glossina fuscipes fuscipes]